MDLPEGIDAGRFTSLVRLAREEDLGDAGDITTALLAQPMRDAAGHWELRARRPGRFCGARLLAPLLQALAPEVRLDWIDPSVEARDVEPGAVLARFAGRVGQMLAAERTLLNFLQRTCGVATLTQQYVRAVATTRAKVYDTRKTLPGWRDLDRYAVRCGGGHNHRRGLHDAVLIKDNHLAGVPADRLAHVLFDMLNRLSERTTPVSFVEVEVDSPEQLGQVFKVVGVNVVLLDNFDVNAVAAAVRLRDTLGLRGRVELEASGGLTLETVADYARAGVDRLAVGAITHSAVALDLGLDSVS